MTFSQEQHSDGRFGYSIIKPTSWTFESCDFFCTSKASVDLWMFVKFHSRKILKLLNPPKLGAVKVCCPTKTAPSFTFRNQKKEEFATCGKELKIEHIFPFKQQCAWMVHVLVVASFLAIIPSAKMHSGLYPLVLSIHSLDIIPKDFALTLVKFHKHLLWKNSLNLYNSSQLQ